MKKIIVLGDTHGRDYWKEVVNLNPDADHVVFIGDYFDSFNIPGDVQIENFKDILQFKKDNSEKVVLLLGNHDFHYLSVADERYSGFQNGYFYTISRLLEDNLEHMQMAWSHNNYLFTHAGVTNTWLSEALGTRNFPEDISTVVNEIFKTQPRKFRFTPGVYHSNTGDDVTQSPIWVRPRSLTLDRVVGPIHVVGHTHQKRIKSDLFVDGGVIYTDALDSSWQYLLIEGTDHQVITTNHPNNGPTQI